MYCAWLNFYSFVLPFLWMKEQKWELLTMFEHQLVLPHCSIRRTGVFSELRWKQNIFELDEYVVVA